MATAPRGQPAMRPVDPDSALGQRVAAEMGELFAEHDARQAAQPQQEVTRDSA